MKKSTTARVQPVDEAAAYAGVIERLAPRIAAAERAQRRASFLVDDPSFTAVDPSAYDESTVLPVWEASCIVTGINPDHTCARYEWLEKNRREILGEAARLADQALKLHKLAMYERESSGTRGDGSVRLVKFVRWARNEGFGGIVARTVFAPSDSSPAVRVVSTLEQRENAVLKAISKLGHNPLALPARVNGKPWVKSAVRRELGSKGMWAQDSALEHTWERLRKDRKIVEAK